MSVLFIFESTNEDTFNETWEISVPWKVNFPKIFKIQKVYEDIVKVIHNDQAV